MLRGPFLRLLPFWIALAGLHAGPARGEAFVVSRVASGLDRPVFVTAPPGDAERVFILEQHTGLVRILELATGTLLATPFSSIPGVSTGSEQGLLGLAFHPNYASNGFFYVNYTRSDGDTVIARYSVSGDPDVANATETQLLVIGQPQHNHNGGWIAFGPDDAFLYVSVGDGGGANDTGNNAQDTTDNLLGKILRLDVDGDDFPTDPDRNYAIPASNPFVGVAGDDEIWSHGLRNPYRASFDSLTGELYIGDVGQLDREEIDVQPALSGGFNWGWRPREGTISNPGVSDPSPPDAIDPIFDYAHSGGSFSGCAITGGVPYRGPVTQLQGAYFFADYCSGRLWSLRFDGSDPADYDGANFTDLSDHSGDPAYTPDVGSFSRISAFGEDAAGNLYIVKLGDPQGFGVAPNTGEIWRLPEPALSVQLPVCASALAALGALRVRRRRRHFEPGRTRRTG